MADARATETNHVRQLISRHNYTDCIANCRYLPNKVDPVKAFRLLACRKFKAISSS